MSNRFPMHRRTVLAGGVAGGLALSMRPSGSWSASSKPPNILLAVADDWGYPFAGAYGYGSALTETFDRLADEGDTLARRQ